MGALPGGLAAGAFAYPGDDALAGLLSTVAAAHTELKLGLDNQPYAKSAILADFRRACLYIAALYQAPAVTSPSAADWARSANAWSLETGLGSGTIGADLFTAAAIALGVTVSGTSFNLSDGWPFRGLPT